MSFDSLLNETVTVQEPTITQDSSGGAVHSPFVTIMTGVPCAIQPLDTHTVLRWQQNGIDVSHSVYTRRTGWLMRYRLITQDGLMFLLQRDMPYRTAGTIQSYYEWIALEVQEP